MSFISLTRFERERGGEREHSRLRTLLSSFCTSGRKKEEALFIYCACLWEFTCSGKGLVYSSGFFTGRYGITVLLRGVQSAFESRGKSGNFFI